MLVLPALLALPGAAAHGDPASWQETLILGPGEAVEETRPVHWHRVVGTVAADAPVTFLVEGASVQAPDECVVVDHLVRCCEAVWTDQTFAVTNQGDVPVEVRVDLAFLHDNLAVLVDDAEPGAWWQTLLIVGLLIAVPAWRARQRPMPRRLDWMRLSRVFHGAAWLLGGTLALIGAIRFGTGPLVGSVAATAPVPGAVGEFLNTHSLVMLLLMALWGTAYACWAGARRRQQTHGPYDAAAFAAGPLIVGALLLVEYGVGWIPIVIASLPALAIVADRSLPLPHRAADAL